MTFAEAVRSVLGKYATFSGRALRSEYWWFYLFSFLVGVASTLVDAGLGLVFDNALGVVGLVTSLVLMLPSLAVTARRLHDTGRTGWWMVLPMIPLAGSVVVGFATVVSLAFSSSEGSGTVIAVLVIALVLCLALTLAAFVTLLVFLCRDSDPGPNKYGPSPKQPSQQAPAFSPYGGWGTPSG